MRTEMFACVFHPWRLNTAWHLVGAQQISVQRRRMWMKCVGLSQDDSPCVLHSGPALPPEQPRRSSVRNCSLEAGSGVGPGEKCWERKGQSRAGKELFINCSTKQLPTAPTAQKVTPEPFLRASSPMPGSGLRASHLFSVTAQLWGSVSKTPPCQFIF